MVGTGFYSNLTRSQWKVLTAGVTWSSLLGCSGRRSLGSKSRRRQVSGEQWLRLDDVAWIAMMVVEVVGREFGETLGEPSIKDYPRGWMEVWEEEWDIILCSCRPTGGFHLFILFLFMAGVRSHSVLTGSHSSAFNVESPFACIFEEQTLLFMVLAYF